VVLPEPGPLVEDLSAAGVEIVLRPVSVLRRQLMTPSGLAAIVSAAARDAAALRALASRRQVAIVHSNTSVVLAGAAAAAAARLPHVWHVREIYARFGRAWPAYRRLLERAAALPCVSAAAAAQFGPGAKALTIHDGLALDARRAPREQARSALGLPPEAPVIAILGRISDWKGQDVLVHALAEPALADRGTLALIAGEAWPGAPERRDAVLALASRLGVADRVILAGFRDDVENVYGAADVVAVPSTEPDPLPNTAIEAAAAGCAVLASAHGGLPEIIRDGETGRLVAPGDAGALARVAAELLGSPAERERIGRAAAADVRERFAPARLLESVQALYDRL
jgi:glycosyltransferase involved in cell wall biosynthesis